MPTKPTTDTEWATDGGAKKVEPSSGKKSAGWVALEKLPEGFLNYLLNSYHLWRGYLEAAIDAGTHDTIAHVYPASPQTDVTGIWVYSTGNGYVETNAPNDNSDAIIWFDKLNIGDVIEGATTYLRANSDNRTTPPTLIKSDETGAITSVAAFTVTSPGASTDYSTNTLLTPSDLPVTIAAGERYGMRVRAPAVGVGSGARFYSVELEVSRP